jgi:hypothetical protein
MGWERLSGQRHFENPLALQSGDGFQLKEGRRGFDTPAWMLDRAVCSTMQLSPTPFVDAEAWAELRRLLDWALGKENPRVVEGGYQLDEGQGGTYAEVTTPTRATGVVSPAREAS